VAALVLVGAGVKAATGLYGSFSGEAGTRSGGSLAASGGKETSRAARRPASTCPLLCGSSRVRRLRAELEIYVNGHRRQSRCSGGRRRRADCTDAGGGVGDTAATPGRGKVARFHRWHSQILASRARRLTHLPQPTCSGPGRVDARMRRGRPQRANRTRTNQCCRTADRASPSSPSWYSSSLAPKWADCFGCCRATMRCTSRSLPLPAPLDGRERQTRPRTRRYQRARSRRTRHPGAPRCFPSQQF
jgi:hypothetical protein